MFFFFNDTATTEIYTLSLHDALPISALCVPIKCRRIDGKDGEDIIGVIYIDSSVKNYTYSPDQLRLLTAIGLQAGLADRKSTRLNSRHANISDADFCFKKKNHTTISH